MSPVTTAGKSYSQQN